MLSGDRSGLVEIRGASEPAGLNATHGLAPKYL
jgi:hypothetical protein